MRQLITIFLLSAFKVNAQILDSNLNSLSQPANIVKFADHLFCEQDYLRAANEYSRLNEIMMDEKINFKLALSLSAIGEYVSAMNGFKNMEINSPFYLSSKIETMKILFLQKKFSELHEFWAVNKNLFALNENAGSKLNSISFLKEEITLPQPDEFLRPFNESEKPDVKFLYDKKKYPDYKSPIVASIISAIIPGAGKIYTGEISDGIFAFITTGLFAFLAYDNFKAAHEFRGWLFSSLTFGFYAGNVYGSYSSGQIYNARVKYEFNLSLDSLLRVKNYFISKYDFCE